MGIYKSTYIGIYLEYGEYEICYGVVNYEH